MSELLLGVAAALSWWFVFRRIGVQSGQESPSGGWLIAAFAFFIGFVVLVLAIIKSWFGVAIAFALPFLGIVGLGAQAREDARAAEAAPPATPPPSIDARRIERQSFRTAVERPRAPRARKRPKQPMDVLRFDYTDRDGDQSEREVEVTGCDDDYIEGWCRAREGYRTFRLDRIDGAVVSLETGEISDPLVWAIKNADDTGNLGVVGTASGWRRD